ncbi:PREDICTED: uncharacterized protein LOC108356418 [Rhagoletis zephyria]|nr:PREDICTED: uncharacterized protein LOC108356408 [Rhagoletis zephyria]XP_017463020.1 PREDICTED: uncharacterized protein LOC108356418 [Rhagoletis zephyria]
MKKVIIVALETILSHIPNAQRQTINAKWRKRQRHHRRTRLLVLIACYGAYGNAKTAWKVCHFDDSCVPCGQLSLIVTSSCRSVCLLCILSYYFLLRNPMVLFTKKRYFVLKHSGGNISIF